MDLFIYLGSKMQFFFLMQIYNLYYLIEKTDKLMKKKFKRKVYFLMFFF